MRRLPVLLGISIILIGSLSSVASADHRSKIPFLRTAPVIPPWMQFRGAIGAPLGVTVPIAPPWRTLRGSMLAMGNPLASNGIYPTGIAYDASKGEVFVADAAWNNVSVLSDATDALVANIPVGSNPFGLAYDGAKGEIFDANQVSNNVTVISDSTNAVVASVPAGSSPQWEAYDSAKGEVFLGNALSNNVTVMSDATNSVVANVAVGSYPAGVAYDPAMGEVFVANAFSNNVSVISDTVNSVVASVPVGSQPFGAAFDTAKGEVFVANQASNSVTVISDTTNAVLANIGVGSYPTGIAYDSAKGEVFVTNYKSNNVSVLSDATNAVVATVAVGANPFGIAYDPATGEVFVVNSNSNNLSLISDATNNVVATIAIGAIAHYSVRFAETGLPTGTSWSVTLDGKTQTSSTNSITFSESNGSYGYVIGGVPGYFTSPYTGTIVVNGGNVTQTVSWSQIRYDVTFAETGLPALTMWSVTVQGSSLSSTSTNDVFMEPNGTYSYSIGTVPGYTAVPSSGNVTVNGGAVTQPVAFSPTAAPMIISFVASASSITLGSNVTLTVSAVGTGTLTFAYSGLPPGCTSVNQARLTCTPSMTGAYTVRVTVTDTIARSANRSLVLTVNPASTPGGGNTFLGLPGWGGYGLLAAVAIAIAAGIGLAVRHRRHRGKRPRDSAPPHE